MATTSDRIQQLIKDLTLADKTERHFIELKGAYNQKLAEYEALSSNVEKELEDVRELEKLSIKGLFYKALGNNEAQIEKERQEYLMASLQQRGLNKELELDCYELDLLTKRLDDVKIKQAELGVLKQTREKEILSDPTDAMQATLRKLLGNIDDLYQRQIEIQEAWKMGEEVIALFVNSLNHFSKATNWGKWDMAGGTGIFKKSSIDYGLEDAYRASALLARYKKELADIDMIYNGLNLQLGQVNTFMDIIFDNLISDWIVQKRIKNAIATIEAVFDKVKLIQHNVMAEEVKVKAKIEEILRQKNQILEMK